MDNTSLVQFSGFIEKLTESITPAQVLDVLGQVIGVGMIFFLCWLGVRKATKAFTSAVATGKIRI